MSNLYVPTAAHLKYDGTRSGAVAAIAATVMLDERIFGSGGVERSIVALVLRTVEDLTAGQLRSSLERIYHSRDAAYTSVQALALRQFLAARLDGVDEPMRLDVLRATLRVLVANAHDDALFFALYPPTPEE